MKKHWEYTIAIEIFNRKIQKSFCNMNFSIVFIVLSLQFTGLKIPIQIFSKCLGYSICLPNLRAHTKFEQMLISL